MFIMKERTLLAIGSSDFFFLAEPSLYELIITTDVNKLSLYKI